MSSQKQHGPPLQKQISALCDETHSFRAKFAWLSMKDSPVMTIHDQILLLLEYIQILSPMLLFTLSFLDPKEYLLGEILEYICHTIEPASWVKFSEIGNKEITILSLVGAFVIAKYLLLGYISFLAAGKVKAYQLLVQAWRYCFRVQGRILYFIVSSICAKAILTAKETRLEISSSRYYSIMIVSCVMMALELGFTLYLNIFYIDILPSQHFFSAKGNTVEILGIVQKLAIQIMRITLDFTKVHSKWIFTLLNLIIDMMRNLYYFRTLPFYSFKALLYQGTLLMIVTASSVACLVGTITWTIEEENSSLLLILVMWIILAILLGKGASGYLRRIFWNILLNPLVKGSNLLIHRISAIMELRGMLQAYSEFNNIHSWTLLMNHCINSRISDLLKISDRDFQNNDVVLEINNQEAFNKILRNYLGKLLQIHPEDDFLRLYTAHFYIRSLKLIRNPIDILKKLQKNAGMKIGLNTEILLMEIQENLRMKYQKLSTEENHLNLTKFLSEKLLSNQAREKIISQADLQIKICEEIQKETPDVFMIFQDSQRLLRKRKRTTKFIHDVVNSNKISEFNIEPLLLYAKYQKILNHSLQENEQYIKQYTRRYHKYQRYFEQDKLIEENMFDRDVSFAIFSNNEADLGKVFYASETMTRLLGRKNESILSLNVLKNIPPCFHNLYLEKCKGIAKNGEQLINKGIERSFLYDKEGYLIDAEIYTNIHPFVTGEFCVTCVQRVIKSDREYMYVLENGDIDCTTRDIGKKLGIKPGLKGSSPGTDFNIKKLSKELADVNEAFNTMFFAKAETPRYKKAEDDITRAQEIYSLYTEVGKGIVFKSTKVKEGISEVYNCTIENIPFGKSVLKLFTFEEKFKDTRNLKDTAYIPPHDYVIEDSEPEPEPVYPSKRRECSLNFLECSPRAEKRESQLETKLPPFEHNTIPSFRLSLVDSQRNLLSGRDENTFSPSRLKRSSTRVINRSPTMSTGGRNIKPEAEAGVRNNKSIATTKWTKWSRYSQQKRVFTLYEMSLKTGYSPRLYKSLVGIFCLIFILLLASQFSQKSVLDTNVKDLRASKEILRGAQLRTILQVNIALVVRAQWDLMSGTLSDSAFGVLGYTLEDFPYIINSFVMQLSETNQNLLSSSSRLSDEVQEKLYANNVAIYETYFDEENQTYTKINNFQAVNRLIEAGLKLSLQMGMMSDEETESLTKFNLRNSLNDVLISNEDVSKTIRDSLSHKREAIGERIKIFLIGQIIILVGLSTFVGVLFWQQYLKQRRNLSAFCRVHPRKLNEVLEEYVRFRQAVEDENNDIMITSSSRKKKKQVKTLSLQSLRRETDHKNPNNWNLQKNYYILLAKLIQMLCVIILAIVILSIVYQNSINSSRNTQDQIYFLDHSSSIISVCLAALMELPATNNQAYIENTLALDEVQNLIKKMDDVRIKVYETLFGSNQGHSEELTLFIETTLYGEACEVIYDYMQGPCYLLEERGYKTGLVYLLSSFNSMGKALIEEYEDSNKTEVALQVIKEEYFEISNMIQGVATEQFYEISDLLDKKFEEDLEYTYEQRKYMVYIYTLVVIGVSVLVWKVMLVRFKESIERFKNVLSVLPGNLVLSNTILRGFLLKTSCGVLDPIKNDF